jgi:hypothetical protein
MTTEVDTIQVNVAMKLNSNEIEDFKQFDKILNSEVSTTTMVQEDNKDDKDDKDNKDNKDDKDDNEDSETIKIDNNNIDKKEESEKLLKLFKKMNDIFSTEEQSSIENTSETHE